VFSAEVSLLLPDPNNPLGFTPSPAGTWFPTRDEQDVAIWAFEHNQPAGRGTPIHSRMSGLHLPLSAGRAPAGVMSLRPKAGGELSLHQRNLLEHFVRQIALVLDRQRLRDAEINNKLLAESERLSRTLLNSVSHELRTPIAAITSAAGELRSSGTLTDPQRSLATEIESASARLNRVVQSLLSAARLQSGQVRARLDWCDAHDIVQTALRGVEDLIHNHPLEVKVPSGLPLVRVDSVLMEQALANLLTNAATHTPPGTPIEVSARVDEKDLVLEVADRGAGIPSDQLERIFDLFHRVPTAKPGGTGLGLPIVKGFVEAQGSRVEAANRSGGGARFAVFIPITHTPKLPEETA
jgi:two-component system sensor histidine kinase KdpD